MPEPEDTNEVRSYKTAWNSQEDGMEMPLTADELCAMARSREKLDARVRRVVMVATAVFVGAFLYNVYRIEQPWIRLGQAWTLAILLYLFVPVFERGDRRRPGTSEPCAQFLEKQHEERRRGLLRIRRRLILLIPGIVACWWGGGPLATGKPGNLNPASWLFHFYSGPWLFVTAGVGLLLVWLAFGKAAQRAARDREEVRRNIER